MHILHINFCDGTAFATKVSGIVRTGEFSGAACGDDEVQAAALNVNTALHI
jgi:hypothetical protein